MAYAVHCTMYYSSQKLRSGTLELKAKFSK